MKTMVLAALILVAGCQSASKADLDSYARVKQETDAVTKSRLEMPTDNLPITVTPFARPEPAAKKLPPLQNAPEPNRVVIVANDTDSDSVKLAKAYLDKRKVPKENLCFVSVPVGDFLKKVEYENVLEPAVRKHIAGLRGPIDYIVVMRGIPLKYSSGNSVDAALGTMDLPLPFVDKPEDMPKLANPYFLKNEPFSKAKFGFYLVTRIDGYTALDAMKLIDNSMAASAAKGPFLFDEAPNRKSGGYGEMQKSLGDTASALKARGFDTILDTADAFASSQTPLAGYVSWGSNDSAFNVEVYRGLKFLPGAIAETFVSSSGRNMVPNSPGQSQIGDLIAAGVTGVKGYVKEPYLAAMARPNILFDRYTRGFNLAESFYMASPYIKWRDVIVGDPLCRPYPKAK